MFIMGGLGKQRGKAIIRIFGNWDESYQALPTLKSVLKLTKLRIKVLWNTSTLVG